MLIEKADKNNNIMTKSKGIYVILVRRLNNSTNELIYNYIFTLKYFKNFSCVFYYVKIYIVLDLANEVII